MFGFLKQFSEPQEVKACRAALSDIEAEVGNSSWSDVKPIVLALIEDREKTVISVRDERMSPRDLVFMLVTNAIIRVLPVGNYTMYRGVLNFRGQELLKLWDYVNEKLTESGFHTKEDFERDYRWIRDQIKGLG